MFNSQRYFLCSLHCIACVLIFGALLMQCQIAFERNPYGTRFCAHYSHNKIVNFDSVMTTPAFFLPSLQFAYRSFVEPQEVDEIVQLSTHANLVRCWIQPPHVVWPHTVQIAHAPTPYFVDGW